MLRLLGAITLLVYAISPALAVAGAAGAPSPVALPPSVPLSAELRDAALKAGMPVGPLALALEPGAPRFGDGVVALITFFKGKTQKQWLVQFEIDQFNDDEEKKTPGSMKVSIWMTSGEARRKFDFSSTATFALKIRALGPYTTLPYNPKTAAKSAEDKTARVQVGPELLAIGLDRAAQVMMKQGATVETLLEKIADEEEARLAFGSWVSIMQFFSIAQETPGLKEIVLEVVDLPSVWSFARRLGKINVWFASGPQSLAVVDPAGWNLPALPFYRYPFGLTLNEKPAVYLSFFVTAPQPPLLTTAGIVGFTAQSPSHPDKHMLVQIVAAYRGERSVPATDPGKPAGK
jgi:hypothetical protein